MIDDPNNEIKYLTIGKIDKACNKGIIPHMMEHDEPIMIEREDTIYNERFKNVDEYVKQADYLLEVERLVNKQFVE